MHHLREAVEHLRLAGMPDIAEKIAQEARERARAEGPRREPHPEARELAEQNEQLRRELAELRELVRRLEKRPQ